MAPSASASILMMAFVFLLMCAECSSSENCVCSGAKPQLRRKQLSVYFHDQFNVTGFLVAQPTATSGRITPKDTPFGTLVLVNDAVTEGPDPASALLGNYTTSYFESTLYYGRDYVTSTLLTFSNHSSPSNPKLRGLHGTLAVFGITSLSDPQPQPITGGTGSFAFVLGSLTAVPINVSTFIQVYRLDLDLYWPPYAAGAHV